MTLYTVKGSVDNAEDKFYVELLDDDHHLFEDKVNDLLGSAWTDNGVFEISFDDSLFKTGEIEFRPELFIIVRDKNGKILYTSEKKRPTSSSDSANLTFENLSTKPVVDTSDISYPSSFEIQLSAVQRIGDTVDVGIEDLRNVTTLLIQSVSAMLLHNNEAGWRRAGYDGPQVPRYPRKEEHDHELDWER